MDAQGLTSDEALVKVLVNARDRTRDCALALDRALARTGDLARARALARTGDLALALARAGDFAGALAGDRALARTGDRDLVVARDRDLDLVVDLARALARDLDLDFACALALDRTRALARDLDLALRDLDLDRARALARDLDRALDGVLSGAAIAERHGEESRPGRVTRGLVGTAVRMLPPRERVRFREELQGELGELRRGQRLGYAVRVLLAGWQLRRVLMDPVSGPDGRTLRQVGE